MKYGWQWQFGYLRNVLTDTSTSGRPCAERVSSDQRVTKKIIGLFAECLRDSIPRTYLTSVAR